jgi:cystathionine beta-lyase
MTRFDTKLAHLGRDSAHHAQTVNPPVTRASTILFDSVDELYGARGEVPYETNRYGIYGTNTQFELQSAMAQLAGTESCIATASGLSAITATLSAHADPGARMLLQADVYEPTRAFAERELRPHVEVDFFETVDELEALATEETSLILIEVPTSGTMRVIDVPRVAAIARRVGAPLACDSTWGTPRFFDAHALGVDISIHAGTKYIAGHSDVMLGLTTGTYEALRPTRRWCVRHGSAAAPDVCWLGLRGLRTLSVRLERHQASALEVATWLEGQPQVVRVLFPALPSDPDHALWRRQFSGAAGPFSIELEPCTPSSYHAFIESLELFGLGWSWGGFMSMVAPAVPYARRGLKDPPDEGRLVRLHVGLEDPHDLIGDLANALGEL